MRQNYIKNRKLEYNEGLRGDFVKFIQYLHDKVRLGEVRKLITPISAFWSITNKCNLNCRHCYATFNKDNIYKDLNASDALKIIDTLSENGIMELVLQGGEPFCYDHIIDVIQEAKERELVLSILTNGTLLKDKNIDCINNYLGELDLLQISIDGNEKSNDYIRGKGVFQRVIANLNKVSVPNVIVNCVVTEDNIDDLPALHEVLCKETYVKELHFSPLMRLGRGAMLSYPNADKAIEIFLKMKEDSKIKISGSIIPDTLFLQTPQKYGIDMKQVKLGCCAGRSKIFIDHLGNAFSCDYRVGKCAPSFSMFNSDFTAEWDRAWEDLVESSYAISKRMSATGKIEKFCPSLYSE